MKRTFDESLGLVSKKSRALGDPEIRILIPSKGAGAIIGKGGENVKKLRADLNAEIAIPDSSSPERVVHISTPNDNHGEIIAEILTKIEEVVPRKGADSEVRILIHQSQAGAVIGRAGFKIKELRESTGTNITVLSECCPRSTDRVVIIEGELLKIVEAVKEIMKICTDVPIKGMVVNYDACSYEPAFADVYGGYPPDRKSMARGRGGDGLGGPPGLGAGRPGLGAMGRGMGIGGLGGMMRPGFGRGGFGGAGGGGGGGGGGFGGGYGGGPGAGGGGYMDAAPMGGFDDDGEVTVSQFTVPSDLAGTIIGKGGDRINRIREESGARIVVNAPEGESTERVITIQGTPGRIQMAKYLLQQCVKASPAGRRYIQLANM